ncbi:HNH endonuclease [Leptolyngbya sp. FACHB-1515]
MSFDHIHPQSKGGATSFENVCLACRSCNEYKSDSTEGQDPLTGEVVPLFNPRMQQWSEHFCTVAR